MKKLVTALLVWIFVISTVFIALPVIASEEEGGSVYDYAITDITQTAPDTIVVSVQCRFCPYCNPNDPGWRDRGTGCTPFACGYPPPSYPSYAWCRHGSPDGRYAAVRLTGSFGTVTQKLICDQSNWPLNTLWSHNFIFSGLTFTPGETITIEADFYCSYCYHWYATPQTFVPQMYTFVFVPFHWNGPLVAKPSIVSRTEWGCPDGQNSPRWPPSDYPVTHIIIHHTDTPNQLPWGPGVDTWDKVVHKIWDMHALNPSEEGKWSKGERGWGDIGYNYLIDPNGVIYEGRAGGDDVIAGHASPHNNGTMGVAFLGTFSTVEPTSSALGSAQALIAWKCAQRNIDPLGSGTDFAGTYYNYIAGHRDVRPNECPGDKLYNLRQTIRQSVFNVITAPLGSNTPGFETGFFAEVKKQMKLIIDNVGVLTEANTKAVLVEEILIFPPSPPYWQWWPPGWRTIEFSETDFSQAAEYMQRYGWSYMVTFALNHGATGDRYIAITNKEMWGLYEGFANWGSTVICEDSTKTGEHIVLHELGHNWGLLDEYRYDLGDYYWLQQAIDRYRYPLGHPPNPYPGDDPGTPGWSLGRSFDGKRCIMGSSNPADRAFCPPHTKDEGFPVGVRDYVGCAAHVNTVVQREWSISSRGLVSAVITFYRNGTTPKVEEISGISLDGKPMQYFGPGNYSMQVYSETGDLIYNSNITAFFWLFPSQPIDSDQQIVQTDFVTVHWLAPAFSETTVTVELRDYIADEVIASQIVTIVPIAEAWIDYKTTDRTAYNFGDTIEVTTEVETTATSMDIILDVTLLDPNNVTQDYRSWTGTIYPGPDPVTHYLTIPGSGITGTWTVYVVVLNSTGHFQDSESNFITVGVPADITPPTTTLTIGSPQYTDIGGNVYVTSSTSFTLLATDDPGGSGVASTAYKIRNATYDSDWLTYTTSFCLTGLAGGTYFIHYNSTDNAGNIEPTNTVTVILDNAPPTTTLTIGEPKYIEIINTYVTSATPFTLTATDNAGSGVASTAYKIYNNTYDSGWITYAGNFSLPTWLDNGPYLIAYNSTDNLGNIEEEIIVIVILRNPLVDTWMTDSDFNETESFRAVLTPYGNTELYKLTATNPGQFYFNILVNNTWPEPLNITIVYSIDANFTFKGAKPIHVYADLERTIDVTSNCTISGNTITVDDVAPNAIIYVTIHLDYALKGTTWTEEEVEAWYSEHAFNATVHPITSEVIIIDPALQIPPIPLSLIFLMGVLPAIILCLGILIALLKYAMLPTKRRK